MDQTKYFQEGEGDAWFRRNSARLGENPENDVPLTLIKSSGIRPIRVLEVGAANGYRLAWIHEFWQSECWGVDVSQEAVHTGSSRFPQIHLRVGAAHDLSFDGSFTGAFDLVVVNFVFHWVDRSLLLKSISEIDRVLCQEGYLLIGDFYPDYPSKTTYHHLPEQEVWTYKQDYAAPFIASGLYTLVAMATGAHGHTVPVPAAESNVRVATSLLRKVPGGRYPKIGYKSQNTSFRATGEDPK